jgi:hypothetical protein
MGSDQNPLRRGRKGRPAVQRSAGWRFCNGVAGGGWPGFRRRDGTPPRVGVAARGGAASSRRPRSHQTRSHARHATFFSCRPVLESLSLSVPHVRGRHRTRRTRRRRRVGPSNHTGATAPMRAGRLVAPTFRVACALVARRARRALLAGSGAPLAGAGRERVRASSARACRVPVSL